MRAVRLRILRRGFIAKYGRSPRKAEFRQVKRGTFAPLMVQQRHSVEHPLTTDARDKKNWGTGKMQRSGIYATRRRS